MSDSESGKAKNIIKQRVLDRTKFRNIIIVGATASGKSTVGYQLSRLLGLGYIDLDEWIERKEGKTITEIFEQSGEEYFRELEKKMIRELSTIRNHVIVPGAGAIEDEDNWQLLSKYGKTVWLATPLKEIAVRLSQRVGELEKRPLLKAAILIENKEERLSFIENTLQDLFNKRIAAYSRSDYRLSAEYATEETSAQFMRYIFLNTPPTS